MHRLQNQKRPRIAAVDWHQIIIIIIVVNHNRRQKGDSRVIRQSRVWGKYYLEILINNYKSDSEFTAVGTVQFVIRIYGEDH